MVKSLMEVLANKKLMESIFIVAVGLYLHMNQISIIELEYSCSPNLVPNVSSCLFVTSVLCILAKIRPLWPRRYGQIQRFLLLTMEVTLILYAADFALRQVWVRSLGIINYLCLFMEQELRNEYSAFKSDNALELSEWLPNVGRFIFALIVFIIMLAITEVFKLLGDDKVSAHEEILINNDNEEPLLHDFNNDIVGEHMDNDFFDRKHPHLLPEEDCLPYNDCIEVTRHRQPNYNFQSGKLVLIGEEKESFC